MDDFFRIADSHPMQAFIRQANERYLHWDHFRYKPIPSGLSHEEAWGFLKLVRQTNWKHSPLKDVNNRPFAYWVPDHLLRVLNDIDRWSGDTIGADQPGPLPTKERYVISALMDEAIASSQLEGAATTRGVAKAMLRAGRKPRSHGELMIMNNWLTMQYLREHRTAELTPGMLKELHAIVTKGALENPREEGQFRTRDDIIVEYKHEKVHTPPPSSVLPERLEAFCRFANDDDQAAWIHPVVKGVMLHFWLAYDHPFTDGNGRTARGLFYWYLLSRRYWLFEYLSVSKYILRAPGQYVRAYLYTETDGNDLTYFLDFNLRTIRLAFLELRQYLAQQQREVTCSNDLLRHYPGLNLRQKTLVYHAIRHPNAQYTIQVHRNTYGVAYDTARHDLLALTKRGFLDQARQGKEFVFVPSGRMLEKLRRDEESGAKR